MLLMEYENLFKKIPNTKHTHLFHVRRRTTTERKKNKYRGYFKRVLNVETDQISNLKQFHISWGNFFPKLEQQLLLIYQTKLEQTVTLKRHY